MASRNAFKGGVRQELKVLRELLRMNESELNEVDI
jgi:hypothetical protein